MNTPTIIIENLIGKLKITGVSAKESKQIVNDLSDTISIAVEEVIKNALAEYKEDVCNATKAKITQINIEKLSKNHPSRYCAPSFLQQVRPSLSLEDVEKLFFQQMDQLINQSPKSCKENQPVNEAIHSQSLHQSIDSKLDEIISLLKN